VEATADNHVVQGSAVRMILAVMAFALAILSVHPEGNLVIAIIHVVEVSHVKTIQAFVSEMMKKTWQFTKLKISFAQASVKLVQALMKMECSVVLDLNARITSMVMEFVLRCIPPATLCAVELDKHAVEQLKMLSSVAQDMNVKTISMDMAFA